MAGFWFGASPQVQDEKFQKALDNISPPAPAAPSISKPINPPMNPSSTIDNISFKEQYNQLLEELKIRFLLTVSDDLENWYNGGRSVHGNELTDTVSYQNRGEASFTITFTSNYHVEKYELMFSCKGHNFHSMNCQKKPAEGADRLYDAYNKIKKYLNEKEQEEHYSERVNELTSIMETL